MLHGSKGGVLHCHWRVVAAGAAAAVCYCTHARCDLVKVLAGKGNHGMTTCLHGTLSRMRSWCRASEHSIPIRKTASDKRLENKKCPEVKTRTRWGSFSSMFTWYAGKDGTIVSSTSRESFEPWGLCEWFEPDS